MSDRRRPARSTCAARWTWLAFVVLSAGGCGASATSGSVAGPTPSTESSAAGKEAVPATASPVGVTAPPGEWSLIVEPNDGIQPIYSLMSRARHSLDMTMYELADPETITILDTDAARGVRVRVLLDADYSGRSVNGGAYSQLATHGVEVRWAYAGAIFHQKTITVDDTTSAIMTLNLTSEYYLDTRDFAVMTDDSSDVSAIEAVFGRDWSGSGAPGPGVPGSDLLWSPGSTAALVNLIDGARHSLLIENEEMDDPTIQAALSSAASRGVDVNVVMTDSSDWSAAFAQLVSDGVHVRTYAPDASLYIHAKTIVADGTTAFVGSQNFSRSSLAYNRELGLITSQPTVVTGIAEVVENDYAGGTAFPASTATPDTDPAR